jgi:hypothetical protein
MRSLYGHILGITENPPSHLELQHNYAIACAIAASMLRIKLTAIARSQ